MENSRLKWEGFEGLSDARLSVIITQIVPIHNYSDLTEQKMPSMFSGSLYSHSFPERGGYIRKME